MPELTAGSAVYVFGVTGPTFGTFAVQLDDQTIGTYNASTTTVCESLLFVATGLQGSHDVVVTNQQDDLLLAIDYVVAVSSGAASGTSGVFGPTTVFPNNGQGTGSGGSGAAGAAIGGSLGAVAGLVSNPSDCAYEAVAAVDLVEVLSVQEGRWTRWML